MDMRAGTTAGGPEEADLRMRIDPLAHRDGVTVHMAVDGGNPIAMVDLDDLAVIAAISGKGDDPGPCRVDGRHIGRDKIEPGVEGRPAIEWIISRTEPAADLIAFERRRDR